MSTFTETNTMHFSYAVYNTNLQETLIRFDKLSEVDECYQSQFIVIEVSERLKDGGLLIKQKRVVSGPKEWIPIEFCPEYDGVYLCFIERKNECGTISKFPHVLYFSNAKWMVSNDKYKVTHWMIVPEPTHL